MIYALYIDYTLIIPWLVVLTILINISQWETTSQTLIIPHRIHVWYIC